MLSRSRTRLSSVSFGFKASHQNYCFGQFASNEAFFCSDRFPAELQRQQEKRSFYFFIPNRTPYVWYLNVRHHFIHVSTSTNMTSQLTKSTIANFLFHLRDGALLLNIWYLIFRISPSNMVTGVDEVPFRHSQITSDCIP